MEQVGLNFTIISQKLMTKWASISSRVEEGLCDQTVHFFCPVDCYVELPDVAYFMVIMHTAVGLFVM